eukprot:scaffold157131_cov71-Attheya_sp.AAC.1
MEDAQFLSQQQPVASNECVISDNIITRKNLSFLLRKVMQEDSCTWDTIRYLEEMKSTSTSFDYRIKNDHAGRPEAVCWMTSEMRQDLIRFGNILFLDSQKRQFNTPGWPYIGPCIKDANMKVRNVAESICLEESHRMYKWVLEVMCEMERRFTLQSIDIIFADQILTQSFTDSLAGNILLR